MTHCNQGGDPNLKQEKQEKHKDTRQITQHEKLLREDPEYLWKNERSLKLVENDGVRSWVRKQLWISIALFCVVVVLFQTHHPRFDHMRQEIASALTQEQIVFKVAAWYETHLGDSPAFIPSFEKDEQTTEVLGDIGNARTYASPVRGILVKRFVSGVSHSGVYIRADEASVVAVDTGLVLFAGNLPQTGNTILIRHPGGVQSIYGNLHKILVKEDEWIEIGKPIGLANLDHSSEEQLFYFAMKQGSRFIDPSDAIQL
jgi:stage IV sporulation protein FA